MYRFTITNKDEKNILILQKTTDKDEKIIPIRKLAASVANRPNKTLNDRN